MFKYISLLLFSFISLSANSADVSPILVTGATTIDTKQAYSLFEAGTLFVDVRKNSDWEAGRISDSLHLELKKGFTKEKLIAEVAQDASVVFYCNGHNCLRSANASSQAVGWGFTKVYYYRDGFPAWKLENLPME